MLRHPDALRRIIGAPGELGLSRAWVSGELDVDGDLRLAMSLTEDYRHTPGERADAVMALAAARASACCGAARRRRPPSRRG